MYVCRRGCVYDFTKLLSVDVFVIVLEAVFTSVLCVCGRGCVYICVRGFVYVCGCVYVCDRGSVYVSVRLCRCLWLSAVIFYWSLRSVTARLIVLCRPRDGPVLYNLESFISFCYSG